MHTTQRSLLYQTVSTIVGPHEWLIKPEQAARLPGRLGCTAQGGTSYRKFANPPSLWSASANVRTAALANPIYRHVLLGRTQTFVVYRSRIIKTFVINDTLLPMLTNKESTYNNKRKKNKILWWIYDTYVLHGAWGSVVVKTLPY
jgi:hypothetical protein